MYESELYYFSYLVNPFGIILFPIALFRNVFDSLKELATCTPHTYIYIYINVRVYRKLSTIKTRKM